MVLIWTPNFTVTVTIWWQHVWRRRMEGWTNELINEWLERPKSLEKKESQFNFWRTKCTVLGYDVNQTNGETAMKLSSTLPSTPYLYPNKHCLFTLYPKRAGFWKYTQLNWLSFRPNILGIDVGHTHTVSLQRPMLESIQVSVKSFLNPFRQNIYCKEL